VELAEPPMDRAQLVDGRPVVDPGRAEVSAELLQVRSNLPLERATRSGEIGGGARSGKLDRRLVCHCSRPLFY
jgi:hypothetical protein